MAIDGKTLVNPIARWENFMETSEPASLSNNSQASRHTAVMQTLPPSYVDQSTDSAFVQKSGTICSFLFHARVYSF